MPKKGHEQEGTPPFGEIRPGDLVDRVGDLTRQAGKASSQLREDSRANYGVGEELPPEELLSIKANLEEILESLENVRNLEFTTSLSQLGWTRNQNQPSTLYGRSLAESIQEKLDLIDTWLETEPDTINS